MPMSIEMKIARRIICSLIDHGFAVRVFDGEEYTTKGALTEWSQIKKHLASTDMDTVVIYQEIPESELPADAVTPKWRRFGSVTLVWGNGEDLYADSSARNEADLELINQITA